MDIKISTLWISANCNLKVKRLIFVEPEDTTFSNKTERYPQEWYEWAPTALFTYCMSASLIQTPCSFACVPGMFRALNKYSVLFCLIAKIWQASNLSSYSETRNDHRGHVGTSHSKGLRFIMVALVWRAGDWAGMPNMTVLSPWPIVEVMSLSEMNHSNSP